MSPLLRAILWQRNHGLVGLYLLLLAAALLYVILFPGILSPSSLARFGQSWLPLALVAAGAMAVMLTGGIDLAVGSMVSLGSVVAATVMVPLGIGGGTLAVLATGALAGMAMGAMVAVGRLPPIIVTLAASFILSGLALVILPRPGGEVPAALSDALAGELPVALGLVALLPLLWRLFLATGLGMALAAVGDNPVGAYRSGVDVAAAKIAAYGIGGVMGASAGLFIAAQTGSGDPLIGQPFTLNALAAAVVGGVGFLGGQGTLRGALAGSLLLTLLISLMFFAGLPPVTQYLVQGIVIIGAVLLPEVRGLRTRTA